MTELVQFEVTAIQTLKRSLQLESKKFLYAAIRIKLPTRNCLHTPIKRPVSFLFEYHMKPHCTSVLYTQLKII